jgi:undecaprenyl-diphosphatase
MMISFLADWLLIALVVVSVGALLFGVPKGQRITRYSYIVMAGLTALLLARLLGLLSFDETRPFIAAGVAAGASYMDNPGFPSDHAMLGFTLALAVIFTTRWQKLGIILMIMAALVGLGRILALVHTPLDVMGGLLVALVGALWYQKLRQ